MRLRQGGGGAGGGGGGGGFGLGQQTNRVLLSGLDPVPHFPSLMASKHRLWSITYGLEAQTLISQTTHGQLQYFRATRKPCWATKVRALQGTHSNCIFKFPVFSLLFLCLIENFPCGNLRHL